MFQSRLLLTIALVAASASNWGSAFVPHVPKTSPTSGQKLVRTARATWTGRPDAQSASPRSPYAAVRMAAGVTMSTPDTIVAKPTVGFSNEQQTSEIRPEDKYKVLLFNDNGNTREYVSRSLVQVVGLPENVAYQIMQQANDNGMAQVGVWHQEMADAYSSSLKARGLVSDIYPVD